MWVRGRESYLSAYSTPVGCATSFQLHVERAPPIRVLPALQGKSSYSKLIEAYETWTVEKVRTKEIVAARVLLPSLHKILAPFYIAFIGSLLFLLPIFCLISEPNRSVYVITDLGVVATIIYAIMIVIKTTRKG